MNLKTLTIQRHEQKQRVYLPQQCEGGGEGNRDGAETRRVSAVSLRGRESGGRARGSVGNRGGGVIGRGRVSLRLPKTQPIYQSMLLVSIFK